MLSKIDVNRSYEIYADVFAYPGDSLKGKIDTVQQYLNTNYPEAAKLFNDFTVFAKSADPKSWEEIYTRSFDVQALTTLDLGYVLFGDDYKRGELLVNLNNEHKKADNACGNELSDHLPNVLRLLAKLEDEELRADIISLILYPALRKIESEFDSKHIEKKSKVYHKHHRTIIERNESYGLIYRRTIQTLLVMLEEDFSEIIDIPVNDKSFSNQITKELEIEKLG
ncbi:MAG: hypothetical protein K9J16_12030 [Melioribacteraceae bacterium]|nr:hypothetical protein [Melioribacteraceae bacterium]MCF8354144.1 hypothetical protein [Melioribacteraceae bacterium]MCF8393371.1 hypothetical protein [Melioribacteraceae bacterium]MCF8418936.1 hypothetical protein [Melioribacteraceae bacterium]